MVLSAKALFNPPFSLPPPPCFSGTILVTEPVLQSGTVTATINPSRSSSPPRGWLLSFYHISCFPSMFCLSLWFVHYKVSWSWFHVFLPVAVLLQTEVNHDRCSFWILAGFPQMSPLCPFARNPCLKYPCSSPRFGCCTKDLSWVFCLFPQFSSLTILSFFSQLRQEFCSECVRTTINTQSPSRSACASALGMWMAGNSSAALPSATRHSTTGC